MCPVLFLESMIVHVTKGQSCQQNWMIIPWTRIMEPKMDGLTMNMPEAGLHCDWWSLQTIICQVWLSRVVRNGLHRTDSWKIYGLHRVDPLGKKHEKTQLGSKPEWNARTTWVCLKIIRILTPFIPIPSTDPFPKRARLWVSPFFTPTTGDIKFLVRI